MFDSFFFLSTKHILKSIELFQDLQSAQVLSVTLFCKVILPTIYLSGYLTTAYLTPLWIILHFLSHLYTVPPSKALSLSQMNNNNIYLPLLAAIPKRNKGTALITLLPVIHSDPGKTLPSVSWAHTPVLCRNLASHKGSCCFSF